MVFPYSIDKFNTVVPLEMQRVDYCNMINLVREGAILQIFKDDYVFKGSKVQQYKQVGNAVPPLFGEILAKAIRNYLEGKSNIELEYYLQGSFF